MNAAQTPYSCRIDERYENPLWLGQGGFGTVYRLQNEFGKHKVAKFFSPGFFKDNPENMARFKSEVTIGIHVQHDNLVSVDTCKVLPHPETGDLCPTIIMEYVDGMSLDRLVRHYLDRFGRPLPWQYVALIFAKVCAGLQEMHTPRSGHAVIRHGDIKPANVLITRSGCPKLCDFGLSHLMESFVTPLDGENDGGRVRERNPSIRPFRYGSRRLEGSIKYFAPEVISGAMYTRDQLSRAGFAVVSPISDIYSIGVSMLDVCCGLPEFLRAGEAIHVLRAIMDPESNAMLKAHATRHLPRELAGLVRTSVHFYPGGRFTTARQLQHALLDALYGKAKGVIMDDIGDFINELDPL